MVLSELDGSEEDARVFKLVGPALIRQELVEAKANVSKRLEFIANELLRLDDQLTSLEEKSERRRKRAAAIKTQQQQQAQAQAAR